MEVKGERISSPPLPPPSLHSSSLAQDLPPPPSGPPASSLNHSRASSRDSDAPDFSAMGRVLASGEETDIPKLGKTGELCFCSLSPHKDPGLSLTRRPFFLFLRALLTSDLEFLYLDPVAQHHMGPQHHPLLGTSLFNYLHPEELEQAKTDLKGIVESGTLFGSVTRVRFSRLPRIKQVLGSEEDHLTDDAGDHYHAVDLVLNAAGEGLILAFFHAIGDRDEAKDQDEHKKSEWTNWCGTPFITTDMVKLLWDQVDTVPRAKQPAAPAFPPSRVFQVLMASPEHEVLLSHPPARDVSVDRSVSLCDGGYWEEEFQKLLLEISLNPQGGSQFAEAKTTCTRRFRAKHTLLTEGCYRVIESVFIPYGTLIFACFQTVNQQFLPPAARPSAGLSLPAPSYPLDPALGSMHHQPQHQIPHSFPQAPHPGWPAHGAPPPHLAHPHANGAYPAWQTNGPPPHPYNAHSISNGYGPPPPHSYAHPPTAPPTDGYTHDRYESTSPTGSRSASPVVGKRKTPDPLQPSVPLVRPKKSQRGGSGGGSLSASGVPKDPSQLRNGGKPPKGVKECQSCGLKDSPEWRKGESGQKDLCNACGLRYARLVAKQQGKVRSRKKKPKAGQEEEGEEDGSRAKKKAKKADAASQSNSENGKAPNAALSKHVAVPPLNGGPSHRSPGPPQMHSPPLHHQPSYHNSAPSGYPPHQQQPYHPQQTGPVHPYYKNPGPSGNGYPIPPPNQHYLPPHQQHQPPPQHYGNGGGYAPYPPQQNPYPSYSDGHNGGNYNGGPPFPPAPGPPQGHYQGGPPGGYSYGGGVSVSRGYDGGDPERRD